MGHKIIPWQTCVRKETQETRKERPTVSFSFSFPLAEVPVETEQRAREGEEDREDRREGKKKKKLLTYKEAHENKVINHILQVESNSGGSGRWRRRDCVVGPR